MTQEEKDKLNTYINILEEEYPDTDSSIYENPIEKELYDFIDSLIFKYNWTIMAHDTHRWVETDGWYEVEFDLYTGNGNVYINTECGDFELQDMWSNGNPRKVFSLRDCYMEDVWDWQYFLKGLLDFFKETKIMTPEDKSLLLKYLCIALPYGVKVQDEAGRISILTLGNADLCSMFYGEDGQDTTPSICKPYLRPLSSMTEVEKEELLTRVVGKEGCGYFHVMDDGTIDNNDAETQNINSFNVHWVNFSPDSVNCYIDWLLARHFDFMGLIPIDSAVEVTEENNPYKD